MEAKRRMSFCFSSSNLYETMKENKFGIPKKVYRIKYGSHSPRDFYVRMFTDLLRIIFIDIVENGICFMFPMKNGHRSYFHVAQIEGDDLMRARQLGALQDIDLIATNFTGYFLEWVFDYKVYSLKNQIKLSPALHQKFIEKVNQGNSYNTTDIKYMADYMDTIQNLYPEVPKSTIHKILIHGFLSLSVILRRHWPFYSRSRKNREFWIFIGKGYRKKEDQIQYRAKMQYAKDQRMYSIRNKGKVWDGIYYFSLPYDSDVVPKKSGRIKNKITFTDLHLCKDFNRVARNPNGRIFALHGIEDSGYAKVFETLTTRNFEEVAHTVDGKIIYLDKDA